MNGTEIITFKAKDSEILPYSLCLGNISKDLMVTFMVLVLIIMPLQFPIY